MNDDPTLVTAGLTALWAGLLTSVSPCPLATNVAAVAFVTRQASDRGAALLAGVAYALGRCLAYAALAMLLVHGALSTVEASAALQRHAHLLLGPILVLVGMVLLGLLPVPLPQGGRLGRLTERFRKGGSWGALALGGVLAMSFCPVSAALYFGTLLPLAADVGSPVLLPLLFGVATAAPVLVYAAALALGAARVGASTEGVLRLGSVLRPATGVVIVLLGGFLCVTRIFLAG